MVNDQVQKMVRVAAKLTFVLGLAVGVAGSVWGQGPGGQQRPPENLKVLPADTDRQTVMRMMNEFTSALDVRCDHCHAPDKDNPNRMNFASDDNDHKDIARAMMRMTKTINEKLLAEIGRESRLAVTCETCHHGQEKPQTLQHVVRAAYNVGGLDMAIARYKELREKYYGRATFDFGEPALIAVAQDLKGSNDADGAEKVLNLNLTYFPKSASTYGQLAELYGDKGDKAGAIKFLEKALEIDPNNRRIQRQLDRLKQE